jgi:hypothetical protein
VPVLSEKLFFPSRPPCNGPPRRLSGLEKKSIVLDVDELTGAPRLTSSDLFAPEMRNGLFCANNPVNQSDPMGTYPHRFSDGSGGFIPTGSHIPLPVGADTNSAFNFPSGFSSTNGAGSVSGPGGANAPGSPGHPAPPEVRRATDLNGYYSDGTRPPFNPIAFVLNDIGAALTGVAANVVGLVQGVVQTAVGVFTPQVDIVQGFSGFVQALVPRYGNFGGPGYGVGRDPNLGPLFGSSPFNPEDGTYQHHDTNYRDGLISHRAADQQLLQELWSIPQPGILGQIYRAGATVIFGARVVLPPGG